MNETESAEFVVGVTRRLYNKRLSELLREKGISNTALSLHLRSQGYAISPTTVSMLRNFKYNPSEDIRISLAIFLECQIDEIFPEYYDEVYDRASTSEKHTEVRVTQLSLASREVLQLESTDNPENDAIVEELSEGVDQALQLLLSTKERHVLRFRHGLNQSDPQPHTLEDTARSLGVTRERVRQIEKSALEKLRNNDMRIDTILGRNLSEAVNASRVDKTEAEKFLKKLEKRRSEVNRKSKYLKKRIQRAPVPILEEEDDYLLLTSELTQLDAMIKSVQQEL